MLRLFWFFVLSIICRLCWSLPGANCHPEVDGVTPVIARNRRGCGSKSRTVGRSGAPKTQHNSVNPNAARSEATRRSGAKVFNCVNDAGTDVRPANLSQSVGVVMARGLGQTQLLALDQMAQSLQNQTIWEDKNPRFASPEKSNPANPDLSLWF